ncbi:MAG: hypothetical protein ACLSAH_08535 [Bilophila wadsworthia]
MKTAFTCVTAIYIGVRTVSRWMGFTGVCAETEAMGLLNGNTEYPDITDNPSVACPFHRYMPLRA